jgi:hypothetical protein
MLRHTELDVEAVPGEAVPGEAEPGERLKKAATHYLATDSHT